MRGVIVEKPVGFSPASYTNNGKGYGLHYNVVRLHYNGKGCGLRDKAQE
jgi:hypothetical protein